MKHNLISIFIFITLLTGCARLSPEGPYKGDNFLYNSDRFIDTTYKVVDEFLKWELANRTTLDKEITKSANILRANMPTTYEIIFSLRKIYLLDPTNENKQNFTKALEELRKALTIVNKHYQSQLPVKK